MCCSSSLDQIDWLIDFCTKFNRWGIRYVAFNPFQILRNGPIFKPDTGLCLRNSHPSEAHVRRQLFPCKLLTGLILSMSSTWVSPSSVTTYHMFPEKKKSLDSAMEYCFKNSVVIPFVNASHVSYFTNVVLVYHVCIITHKFWIKKWS